MKAVRAFQTLTHPGQLGASFWMMEGELKQSI